MNTPVEDHFFVVGIGTSAGGLKALRLFFENCPDDTGMAFVIVQHLSPNYKSLMPELLSKNTNMPIAEAQDNVLVEPNNVYLIPGNKNLLIQNNYLILENRPVQTMNFAIDIFFSSLATDKSHLAIGIILSGTGTDGTKGAKAIKERGGTIIAQSPRSSGFDGMPRSVISQDLPDLVLTPQDMASELIQYAKNPQFNYLISGTDLSHKMSSINKILKIIKEKNEIDFSGYKLQTILRRTAKRLNITKSKSIEDYIDTLYESPEEVTNLAQEYLIGVTSFFRDSAVFEYVNEHIIPEIVTKADQTENIIKIWIIACSSGEEVYTIAMLLDDYLIKKELNIKYKIYGTDVDDNAVYKASKGIYDLAEVKGIPETFLERYFERTGGTFKVKTNIRENIIFSKHNVVVNPPFSKMDLISCRNLLIYLDTEYKHHTLSTIKYALNPNGYLLLGKSETTGVFDKSFKNVSTKYRVYQNTGSVYYSSNNPKNWKIDSQVINKVTGKRNIVSLEDQIFKAFNEKVIKEYDSASVCVDDELNIIHAIGAFKKYIDIPEFGFSRNLMKILSNNLLIPIQSAIRKISRDKLSSVDKEVRLPLDETTIQVKVIVEKITFSNLSSTAYVITILETGKSFSIPQTSGDILSYTNEDILHLKETLTETKENLQLSIEELETSNEELQATNEELLASNEELQSTNEELQSVNEELHSVNGELQSKNIELLKLNSDVENLFSNVQIGTLFLDENNQIARFTPAVYGLFEFRNEDIGRPIRMYSGIVEGRQLVDWSERVKSSGEMYYEEVQNEDGKWHLIEVFPYRNVNGEIDGVTINFINIDPFKKQSIELKRLFDSLDVLTSSTPAIITVCDTLHFRPTYSKGNVNELLGISVEEFEGENISDLIYYEDKKILERHIKNAKKLKDGQTINCKVRVELPKTKEIKTILISTQLYVNGETTKSNKTINVIQDISSVTEMESVLKSREERYKLAVTSRKTGLWECEDINTGKVWWSEEYLALLEYDENALQKGYEHFLSIIHPDDYPNFKEELENSFNTKQPFSCLLRLQHQSKGYRWYEIYGITELEKKSKKKRLICCISDIHERVIYQKVIESKQKLLTNIFDYSSVGFVVADGKGIIEECSNGFARTVGIDPAEIKGKAYYEFISKDQKEAFYQNFEKLTKEEIPFLKMEAHYVGGMNQQIWCKVHITPIAITTESGHDENKYCAIITDQTEEKNQETDLQPIFPELDSMSTSTSEIIHSQISELRENLQSSEDNRKGNLALLDSLDQNLNKIQSQLASMNDYNSLLNTNSDFSNINLNKLIKKTINEDILGQKINLKKEILPGIYAVESQIELLIQSIIKVAYHLCNQNIPDDLTLSAKANSSSWEFKLNLQSKSLSSSLLEEANRYLMGEISKIEDQHQLVILLLVCRKIINNHKGNFYLLNSKKSGCDILFSIAKYE